MTTDKKRIGKLITWADEALREQAADQTLPSGTGKMLSGIDINDSYNGAVAALGVSIAMGGLRPALAIYYQEGEKQDNQENAARPKANRRTVLDVIARMITMDAKSRQPNKNEWDFSIGDRGYAYNLFNYAIANDDMLLKQEVIDCSIALKHIVRTYNLVK